MAVWKSPKGAEFIWLNIEGFYQGKWWKDFQPWRLALSHMIGAEIDFRLIYRPFRATSSFPGFEMPEQLQVLEAVSIGGAHSMVITPEMRSGYWMETPDEPLLVLLLLSIPGKALPARHAAAIAQRLVDMRDLIEALDTGIYTLRSLTDMHEAALAFFMWQAREGADVLIDAIYSDGIADFGMKSSGAVEA